MIAEIIYVWLHGINTNNSGDPSHSIDINSLVNVILPLDLIHMSRHSLSDLHGSLERYTYT